MTLLGLLILISGIILLVLSGAPSLATRIHKLQPSMPNYKYWVFGAIAIGFLGSVLDHGSTNVALPTIASHFHTDIPTIQWVVIGYTLTITALLLPMGRLSDLLGRKKVYLIGSAVYVIAAGLAGSSISLPMLISVRLMQGVGAAMVQGTGMAIMISAFPSSERGKAIGLVMAIVGSGNVAGPALGGLLVDAFGWPSVFFINVPVGLLGIFATIIILQEPDSAPDKSNAGISFDWLGAALSTGALVTLLLAMTMGHRAGWTSPPIIASVIAFFGLSASFIRWELHTPNPMLDLRLFGRKTFSFGVSAAFLNFLGSGAVLFIMPFYLQGVLGYGAATAGFMVMPGALLMAVMGSITGTLSDRFGWRIFTVGGMSCVATGLFILSRLTEQSSWTLALPGLMFVSAGQGIFYSPNSSSVLSSVELQGYGIVVALLNLVRNGANIISLAMGTAIITATMGAMGFEPSFDAVRESESVGVSYAFSVGLRNALLTMMALMMTGMAISALQGEKDDAVATTSTAPVGQNSD